MVDDLEFVVATGIEKNAAIDTLSFTSWGLDWFTNCPFRNLKDIVRNMEYPLSSLKKVLICGRRLERSKPESLKSLPLRRAIGVCGRPRRVSPAGPA